jgi:hypothetical protein
MSRPKLPPVIPPPTPATRADPSVLRAGASQNLGLTSFISSVSGLTKRVPSGKKTLIGGSQ